MKINKVMIILIILFSITFIGCYQYIYLGDYIIQDMYLANSSKESNITYCDNCLWIKWYEGCNRYKTYYFENEHKFNPMFNVGDVVNIYFQEVDGRYYVRQIIKAYKYRSCT